MFWFKAQKRQSRNRASLALWPSACFPYHVASHEVDEGWCERETKTIANENGLKQKACSQVISSLVALATSEVKKTGVFTLPGVCRIKTRTKPATKAGVRMMFGKETKVKAKPAKTVVKAFPVAALKKQI